MLSFIRKVALFYLLVFLVLGLLFIVDLSFYDRISNEYLMHALRTRDVKRNVVVGSSKLKWSVVDTLLAETTVLAEGGQFAYATAGVLGVLAEHDLLRGRSIFLDLEESDELASGFGQWWYFSEAFLEYRYARLSDYPLSSWPHIFARVARDLAHLTPNHEKVFAWQPLEASISHRSAHVDADSIRLSAFNFKNCVKPLSDRYRKTLTRLSIKFNELEKEHGCRIYIVLPPFPKSGCAEDYSSLFGQKRVIDLAVIGYDLGEFHDNSHLNSKGAIRFSRALSGYLRLSNHSFLPSRHWMTCMLTCGGGPPLN